MQRKKKGRKVLKMSIEVSPLTKHRLKLCATNLLLALLCLFSSNQRQVLQNREKHTHTHPRTLNTHKHTSISPLDRENTHTHTESFWKRVCKTFSKACLIPTPIVAQHSYSPLALLSFNELISFNSIPLTTRL